MTYTIIGRTKPSDAVQILKNSNMCRAFQFLGTLVLLVAHFDVAECHWQIPMVKTTCGWIKGEYDFKTRINSFKGIPFAEPPVGPLRWTRPVPLPWRNCWNGVLSATSYPPACAHVSGDEVQGSEDCLYLNVFTPNLKPRYLSPVMVYIHGGALQWGSSSWPGNVPDEEVAQELGVVIVSIQYRLSSFGFLVLDALEGKGNYGLWDQVEALRWVRRYIGQFGGNPDQVTLFGHSSGGTSIFALLASPIATDLFHAAWLMSPSPVMDAPIKLAAEYNTFFLHKTGCYSAACLRSLNTSTVLEATYPEWDIVPVAVDIPRKDVFEPALVVIDGELLTRPPFSMWDEHNPYISYVPVMIGVTAQELDVAPKPQNIKTMTKEEVTEYIAAGLDTFGGNITNQTLALYNYTYEFDAEYIFSTIASDVRVICGNGVLVEKAVNALGPKVYQYVVTSSPSVEGSWFGFKAKYAFHGWELYAFFNTYKYLGIENPTKSDLEFGNIFRENMMHFVHYGTPADSNWKPFIYNTTALISDKMEYTDIYHKKECKFWIDNGFFPYSWIN